MNHFPFIVSLTFVFSVIILGMITIVRGLARLFKIALRPIQTAKQPFVTASIAVMVMVGGICLSFYGFAANRVLHNEHNTIVLASDMLYTCVPEVNRTVGEKVVILRLDDVQAYGWAPISVKMMRDAKERNMPVVAGIIPKKLLEDKHTVRFLKRNACNLEFALHGFDHGGEYATDGGGEEGEFAALKKRQALARLSRGEAILAELSDRRPYTFIPPQNQISDGAQLALLERTIPVLSGEGDGYFDYDAATWNFEKNEYVASEAVLADCEASFALGDQECVIMLHPQDYSLDDRELDSERYQDYLALLQGIEEREWGAVTFSDVVLQKGVGFTYVADRYSPLIAY